MKKINLMMRKIMIGMKMKKFKFKLIKRKIKRRKKFKIKLIKRIIKKIYLINLFDKKFNNLCV